MRLIDKLRKKYLNIPNTASGKEWDKLTKFNKTNKRLYYFLLETIPDIIHYNIINLLKDIKYWFKYRFCPNYWKFWIIKPKTLKIGYNDARELILHTNMQILSDFYEFQMSPNGHVAWDSDEEHRNEIKVIYKWWKSYLIYKKYLYKCRPLVIKEPEKMFNFSIAEQEEYKEYFDWLNTQHQIDIELELEEDIMINRLIAIRLSLWD